MFYKHLQGVIPANMCDDVIQRAEEIGFAEAPINMGNGTEQMRTDIRNNERVIIDDRIMRIMFQSKIAAEIPLRFKGDLLFLTMAQYFRVYKYVPGQYFKPHRDGSVDGPYDSESEITVLFYLNDTDGGETVLMPYGKSQEWSYVTIAPKKGDVLMFEHKILHEGREVNSGVKYVLRSDLFYFDDPM